MNALTNSQSWMTLDLGYLASKQSSQTAEQMRASWVPKHADLAGTAYPIMAYDAFKKLKAEDQLLL